MIARLRKLLIIALIVGAVATIIVLNLQPITVNYFPGHQFTLVGGVVFLLVFGLGFGCAVLFGLYFGIKSYFRERNLQSQVRQGDVFYDAMIRARSYLSSHEWGKARECWESAVRKDPSDVIARIELSRSLEGAGQPREALKILEAARATSPNNTEVLFRAAELQIELGNKTAAIDNLVLILSSRPNRRAAILARDLSEELGRLEDALEYNSQFDFLGTETAPEDQDVAREVAARLNFKKTLQSARDDETLVDELGRFLKKHPTYAPALQRLAQIESDRGNIDEAAQLLVRAAKQDGSHALWYEAVKLWVDHSLAERAVAAAKTAVRNAKGTLRFDAELDLARLMLALGRPAEARETLEELEADLNSQGLPISADAQRDFKLMKGRCLHELGDLPGASRMWQELTDGGFAPPVSVTSQRQKPVNGTAPAPQLSTP